MKILVYEMDETKKVHHKQIQFVNLDELVSMADIISLHVDLNKGNEGFIIKETDRIKALIAELKKIGVEAIDLDIGNLLIPKIKKAIHPTTAVFKTYEDHRMAMCLAPLSMLFDSVSIENPEGVVKSYPHFWDDLKSVGFVIK